jgi:hypothetical protein
MRALRATLLAVRVRESLASEMAVVNEVERSANDALAGRIRARGFEQ